MTKERNRKCNMPNTLIPNMKVIQMCLLMASNPVKSEQIDGGASRK